MGLIPNLTLTTAITISHTLTPYRPHRPPHHPTPLTLRQEEISWLAPQAWRALTHAIAASSRLSTSRLTSALLDTPLNHLQLSLTHPPAVDSDLGTIGGAGGGAGGAGSGVDLAVSKGLPLQLLSGVSLSEPLGVSCLRGHPISSPGHLTINASPLDGQCLGVASLCLLGALLATNGSILHLLLWEHMIGSACTPHPHPHPHLALRAREHRHQREDFHVHIQKDDELRMSHRHRIPLL